MAQWTLTQNDGDPQTLAAWGLAQARLSYRSLDLDTLEFIHEGTDFDGAPIFADGDKICVFFQADTEDPACVFVGYVRDIQPDATGKTERISYRVENAWGDLRHKVLQKQWYFATDPTNPASDLALAYVSQVILGYNITGLALQNIGEIIAEILAFAISTAGVPMLSAGWTETTLIPIEETRDLVIAGAIQRILRWLPDVVTWWDYTTVDGDGHPLPTLHISRVGALTPTTVAITTPEAINLRPRHDLQIPAVVLRYILAGQNDNGWNQIHVDKYPDDCTGFEYNALVATLELIPGRAATTVEQAFQTIALLKDTTAGTYGSDPGDPADSDWQASALAFMEYHFPGITLPHITAGHISSLVYSLPSNTPLTDGVDFSAGLSLLSELVDGAVTPWMKEAPTSIVTQVAQVQVTYTWTDSSIGKKFSADFVFLVRATSLPVTGLSDTDSLTLVTSAAVEDEAPPTGLAENLFSAMNPLQWSGTIELAEGDASSAWRPGVALNFSGGNTAWATMAAFVSGVDVDLESGTTKMMLGVADHLGPQDLIERLRLGRDRAPAANLYNAINGTDASPEDDLGLGSELPIKPTPYLPAAMAADGGSVDGYSGSGG